MEPSIEAEELDHELVVAEILCNEQRFAESFDLASQCLKRSEEIYGVDSILQVTPYVVIGRSHAGLGKFSKAEKIFSLANYLVIKTKNCPSEVKSKLYRALGNFYRVKKAKKESLRLYAEDVYTSSISNGALHHRTAGAYCGMAAVFVEHSEMDTAQALYLKVCTIWHTALQAAITSESLTLDLSDVEKSDARLQLLETVSFFTNVGDVLSEGQGCAALGILSFLSNAPDLAEEYGNRALPLLKDTSVTLYKNTQSFLAALQGREGSD
eukprot:m.85747 g.85747  ORF g.85747 m.85747 type:complete len:268 (-) comp25895_c1_seq1:150-953(-)